MVVSILLDIVRNCRNHNSNSNRAQSSATNENSAKAKCVHMTLGARRIATCDGGGVAIADMYSIRATRTEKYCYYSACSRMWQMSRTWIGRVTGANILRYKCV
ncbi:hypothetical protein AB1N83_005938 [Pleurotus pulmonarius]